MTSLSAQRKAARLVTLLVIAGLAVEPAAAQSLESGLQNILNMLQGNVVRILSILGVMIAGILWIFGYIDFRRAASVFLGIVVIFGAAEIVNLIAGTA
jgi:type IV secretion system protein VirB2